MKRHVKRQTDKTDKRRAILDAAVEVFARHGFSDATINDVAEKANIAGGTVYLYFKNKEDLLIQAMNEIISSRLAEIKKIISHEINSLDRLYKMILLHVELFSRNPYVVKFMVSEWRQSDDFYQLNPEFNPFREYLDYVTSLCQEAIDTGSIGKLNPRTLAYIIVGTMDFVLTQWITKCEPLDPYLVADEVRQILRHGVHIPKPEADGS